MGNSKGSGRTCMFCGATPTTNEHIWPEWFTDVLLTGVNLEGFELSHDDNVWLSGELNRTINRYCDSCNSGWMSRIEGATKPTLAPMMTTQTLLTLSPAEQERLATWAVKTVLVLASQAPGTIPQEKYREFFEEREPVGDVSIWLAAYIGRSPFGGGIVNAFWGEEDGPADSPSGYWATIQVHRTVIQVLHHFGRRLYDPGNRDPRIFQRIWPPTEVTVVWPGIVGIGERIMRAVLAGEFDLL